MNRAKMAIFGGSFNPIHNSHIKIIKEVLNKNLASQVWIMPCKKHAFNKELSSTRNRLAMIKLAIKGIKKAKICRIELQARGKNYTLDTIRKLKSIYSHQFFLVIGSDITQEIAKWHEGKKLLKETSFIIFKRKGCKIRKIKSMNSIIMNNKPTSTSSTEIRNRIKNGKTLKHLIPKDIIEYISKRGLYK